MRRFQQSLLGLVSLLWPIDVPGQDLILHDFGPLKNDGARIGGEYTLPGSRHPGGPGDHRVSTSYFDRTNQVLVNVTIETFSLSVWLLHEFEAQGRIGPTKDRFGGNVVGGAGQRRFEETLESDLHPVTHRDVAWLTGDSSIVQIEFDLRGTGRTAEIPTDIVDAYLALYPSSLPDSITDTPEHHTQWVRDEFRRILEYASRDLGLAHTGTAPTFRNQQLNAVHDWLQDFARYREAFYATGSGEQFRYDLMIAQQNNLKADGFTVDFDKQLAWAEQRLNECKTWWAAHESDPVQLPTPGAAPKATYTMRVPRTPTPPPAP